MSKSRIVKREYLNREPSYVIQHKIWWWWVDVYIDNGYCSSLCAYPDLDAARRELVRSTSTTVTKETVID